MNILKKVKFNLSNIKESIKRFPITLLSSTFLAILLIIINEGDYFGDEWEYLYRISMVLGIGIALFLSIELLIERMDYKKEIYSKIAYALGFLALVLYYFVFLREINLLTTSRYAGTIIFFLLASLYIPRLEGKNDYEYYILDIKHGFSITLIYSLVLFIGLSAIFLTIDQLFDANIPGKLYLYIFIVNYLIFAVALFLSKIPLYSTEYKDIIYNKSLSILLNFIVVPLISIYTLILYAYFVKILISGVWPKGLVSHLVLWYSTISVGVIFFLTPLRHESKISWSFTQVFPKAIIPVLIMMFLSIHQRIAQYGISENRYYIVVLGLWVLAIMVYFSFKRPFKNIIIPISLSLVILNSVYGPLSSFAVSKYSQNKRFNKVLNEYGMLVDGQILANPDISNEGRKELNNIIKYFDLNHKLSDIKVLPKDFKTSDSESLLGFKYDPYYRDQIEENKYFYYGLNYEYSIDIGGYDHYMMMYSWADEKRLAGDLELKYDRKSNKLIILKDTNLVGEINIGLIVEDLISQVEYEDELSKTTLNSDEMTTTYSLTAVDANYEFKFIFTNINGRHDNKGTIVDSVDFIILLGER